ncbi:TonB-dependent receptor [Altererythrobacter soli]|uniref:TonB-dependent receptor n=1 Tax=Croceibacterium soli TaxID=1739690 RepID=A0A6I4UW95_9SPHN|nr:TonB-dependent receptor [Croceibacterium soli]MXP42144.1 TonB-dependent receptor [Croceibacterium soli]
MNPKYLTLAPLLLPAAPALAQEAGFDPDVIVVTGEGLPDTPASPAYDTQVLERDRIVSTGSGRLEDALSSVAGFQQFRRSDSRSSNPSAQGVTLRALGGNATSRALVLLDGVPLADPFFGYIPLSAVAPERLENIRVTRGGGSGPFGAGALAGTIELNSADASDLGLVTASALINDRAETELSGTFAPEVGNGYATISGRWDRGKGFYTTPEDQRVPATARARFDSWSAGGRLVQDLGGDITLQVRGLAFEDHRTLRFEGADSSSEGQDISLRVVGRGPWQFDAIAYKQWRNFTNVVVSSTRFVPVLDQKDTPSEGEGGKIEVRPPVGGGHTLRLGADFRQSTGDLFEDAYSAFTGARTEQRFAGGENTDLGLFAEDDWQIGPVILTGGVRADRYEIRDGYYRALSGDGETVRTDTTFADRSDWEFSYRGGVVMPLSSGLQVRAAAYSGLRLPTLNELYRPFVVFPVETRANENLVPERLEGFDVGLDWRASPGVRFALTAWDNKVKDAITNVTIGTNLRERRNIGAIDARGLEFSAELEHGPFGLDGSLAYTDAEQEGSGPAADLNGFRPSQTPAWAASATASYRPAEGMLLAATLRHVGKQFEDDQESDVLPAATTVDLYAQVPLYEKLSFVARAENLFDEEIVTRNQGGSIDLGIPRTVWAGLRYGF